MLWGVTEGATKKLRSNIRRSTETGIAVEMRSRVTRQGSRESTDGSTNSNSSDGTCVQPTHRGPRPPPWSYTEPGAGQENLQLDFQPRCLGSSVPLSPTILFPRTSCAWAPVLLWLQPAVSHPNAPVAREQFIPSVCFMPPASQHLHAAPLQRRGFKRKM